MPWLCVATKTFQASAMTTNAAGTSTNRFSSQPFHFGRCEILVAHRHPLVAPEVRPWTNSFCASRNSRMPGASTMMQKAYSAPVVSS